MTNDKDAADDLRQLQEHPVLTRRLPGRAPLTRERAELGGEVASDREAAGPAIRTLPEWREAVRLIERLGAARYAAAVRTLTRRGTSRTRMHTRPHRCSAWST